MLYEFESLFEEVVLSEAKKAIKLITDRSKGFKRVNATILSDEFIAHKNNYSQWCVTDAASGLLIQSNFRTLADAKEFVDNMDAEMKSKIEAVRQSAKYKEACDRLANADPEQYEMYESLEDMNV